MKEDDVDDKALRRRFESHLPKYGTLWKSMAPKKNDFLTAIENKTTVSLNINVNNHDGCPFGDCEDGTCAAPTYEEVDFATPLSHDSEGGETVAASPDSSTSSGGNTVAALDFSNLQIKDENEEAPKKIETPKKASEGRRTMVQTPMSAGTSEGSKTVVKQSSPGESASSPASSTSSGGSTVIAFDLSCLLLQDDKENSNEAAVNERLKEELNVQKEEDDSFEHLQHEKDFGDDDDEQSVGSDEQSDSSGGSTVIRFDISYLLDQTDGEQRDDDEDFEILAPATPTLHKAGDDALVDTPPPTASSTPQQSPEAEFVDTSPPATPCEKKKAKGYETGDSWLVEDEESDEESWVRPNIPSKRVEIVSDSGSDSETKWSGLENREPENTIIILSDDESSVSNDSFIGSVPRKPDATKQPSKGNFRKNRDKLTAEAFAEFNELVFNHKLSVVTVTWSNKLRTTAGLTRCKKERGNSTRHATIELSMKVIDEHHRLRHTLLHEMCHAAQWLVDDKINPPHGVLFKKWANHAMDKIQGAIVTTTHNYAIQYKHAWSCTTEKCGALFQRQSKSIDVNTQVCGKCKGRLVEINVPQKGASKATVDRTPKKKKPLSGYALFVKENSAKVRKRMELDRLINGSTMAISQPEVMKACAQLWHEKKNVSSMTASDV